MFFFFSRHLLGEGTPLPTSLQEKSSSVDNMTDIYCICHRLSNHKLLVDILATHSCPTISDHHMITVFFPLICVLEDSTSLVMS